MSPLISYGTWAFSFDRFYVQAMVVFHCFVVFAFQFIVIRFSISIGANEIKPRELCVGMKKI